MQRILIKKDAIIFSYWEEQSASWIDRNIKENNLPISWYLPYSIEIEKGVTLRDFLTLISYYEKEIELIFANYLAGIPMSVIRKQIESSDFVKKDLPINTLYLFKIGEINYVQDEELPLINIYPVLVGLYERENEIINEDVYYLSTYDVRNWVDHRIEIDDLIEFTNVSTAEVETTGLINWNFFEMISTILYQVSISFQVSKAILVNNDQLVSGPMLIDELFIWIDELDRIFLNR